HAGSWAKLGAAAALGAMLPEWAIFGPVRAYAKTTGPCPPQPRKPCDAGVRADWVPGCKKPVAKGKASEFNGCGPQAGLDLPVLGHGDWVPDRPLELANFFDACKAHDCCYGQCGTQKADCDSAFGKATMEACVSGQGLAVTALFGGLNLSTCLGVAQAYHAAVADTQTGQDAYNAGQAEVCDCCETYIVQFDSLVTLTPSGGSSWSGSFQYEYTAQITLTTPADGSAYASGSAQGSYAQASGTMTDQTDSGTLVWTLNSGTGAMMQVVDFELGQGSPTITLTVAVPVENYTLTVPDYTQSFPGPFWVDVFLLEENVNYDNGQVKLALQPGPGATTLYSGPVAQGTFVHSSDIGTLNGGPAVALTATEKTTVTVTAQ
ncbi:MAG: hypothetical protein ACRDL8_13595, partial [Solirubrobacteraceae bacterium]